MSLPYLAYGSNLHPVRIAERVPSSRLIGVTRLDGYSVTFVKRSRDGSAKCNLVLTGDQRPGAYAAVYEIADAERCLLDRAEGLGSGYEETRVAVHVNGARFVAFAYVADRRYVASDLLPYDWYKALVVEGARYHRFPRGYLSYLGETDCRPDPDRRRSLLNETLLTRMRGCVR
jgi:gamma-glutamylcyclotransferase